MSAHHCCCGIKQQGRRELDAQVYAAIRRATHELYAEGAPMQGGHGPPVCLPRGLWRPRSARRRSERIHI